MAITLNLEKARASLTLNLQKVGIMTPPTVEIKFMLDVSGSFEDEHRDGITNDLITRLVPWGLTFDPDKKLDLSTFSNGPESVQDVGPVTEHNYKNFVSREIIGKVRGWKGGTDYSYALEDALRSFGWLPNLPSSQEPAKPGFFGKLFGKKVELTAPKVPASEKRKSLVIFVTDGENADQNRTKVVLRESQARGDGCYFLFIGVQNGGGTFSFLETIDAEFSNTAFYEIKDLRKFVSMSDEELYGELLCQELLNWLKD